MNSFSKIKLASEKYLKANPGDSVYFLIDHAGMPGLYRKIVKRKISWTTLFDTTRESAALLVAPILILIGCGSSLKVTDTLIEWISEQADEGASVIMLASNLPISELQRQLTLRLDVKISQDMDAMLRFFDARIFEKLAEILTPEQMALLCSPAKKWWYVNRAGEFVGVEKEFRFLKTDFRPLVLTEKQEFALVNASEPDQVLHLLLNAMPRIESLMPRNKYRFIANNITSASALGLNSVADFVLYSAMVAIRGSDFEVLPYWENILPDVRDRRISFADAVAGSEDVSWEME